MKRSSPPRRTSLPRRTRPAKKRNPKRKRENFARAYGSKARVEWFKSLPCVVCVEAGIVQPSPTENAHAVTGGMGRKADASTVVPLCRDHHRLLHREGSRWFEDVLKVNLRTAAKFYEAAWRCYAELHGLPHAGASE